MKKIIPLLLIVCLLGSFAACGSKQTEQVAIITPEPLAQTETTDTADKSVAIPDLEAAAQADEQDEDTEDEDTGDSQVSRADDSEKDEDNNNDSNNSNSNNDSNSNNNNSNSNAETNVDEPAEEQEVDLYSVASGYVGSTLSALQGAVGGPNSQEYVVSCIEDAAEEGVLYYDGFLVVTTRYNDGTEIVTGVSPMG